MADDIEVTPGSGAPVATDEVAGRHYQLVKLVDGTPEGADGIPGDASTGLVVNTELAAPAALADGAANPTTATAGAALLGYSGGQWWRIRCNPPSLDAVPADQVALQVMSFLHGYNGDTWDRMRGDVANGLDVDVTRLPGSFAEDAAHASGALGLLGLAVRRDADTTPVDADGDYSALLVDSIGRLKVRNIKDAQIVGGSVGIANGASLSSTGGDAGTGIITLTGKSLVGIQMPVTWTAANLTFQGSMDGGTTFNDLYDDTGTERTVTAAASRAITLDPTKFMGLTHLKIRSGTTAAAVNQGGARTLLYTTIAL